jgi:hypothetical protein
MKTLKEILDHLPEQRRTKIEARAEELISETRAENHPA